MKTKYTRKLLLFVAAAIILFAGVLLFRHPRLVTGKTLADSAAHQIAFIADREIYVFDDANNAFIQLTRTGNNVRGMQWSPDGRYLAFVYLPPHELPALYRLDVTGGDLLRLTPEESEGCVAPSWSPDGTQIACFADASLPGKGQIMLLNADGTDFTLLTKGSHPSWSADGARLLYVLDQGTEDEYSPVIATIDLRDGEVTVLFASDEAVQSPQWSPDESKIAFFENRYDPTWGGLQDYTLKMWDGQTIRTVSEDIARSVGDFGWSPDGTELRFMACKYNLASAETTCPLLSVYNAYSPDWSQIVYFDEANAEVCLIPMQTDCVKVPKSWRPGFVWPVAWRP